MLETIPPAYLIGVKSRPSEFSILQLDLAWNEEPRPISFIIASQDPLYLQTLLSNAMTMDEGLKQSDREQF